MSELTTEPMPDTMLFIIEEQYDAIVNNYSPDCFIVLLSSVQLQAAMSNALDCWEAWFWNIDTNKSFTEIRHIED